jgi:hypothetical protein
MPDPNINSCCRYFTAVGELGGPPGTMRSTPGDFENEVAILEGYTTPGDGGGGVFHWSLAGIDDGGTVFGASPNVGAPVGYWVRIYSGALSVKWFGAKGTSTDDTSAIQAAYRAAAALGSASVYFPAGFYGVTSTVLIGDEIADAFTCISTIGDGPITTAIVWMGSIDDIPPPYAVLLYWRNKYARMVGISVRNGATQGTMIGTLLSGPAAGTQSNSLTFKNCVWMDFSEGVQAGGGVNETAAASELLFINCSFQACINGFAGQSTGNTINIWFHGCSFDVNTAYGAYLGQASSVHFWGGHSHGNGIATIYPTLWQQTLRVEAFRFEIGPGEVAIKEGAPALIVENCIFAAADPNQPDWVPEYPVIGNGVNTIIRGCVFGNTSDLGKDPGWLTYDTGQSGTHRSLEMVGNDIHGTKPFYIHPGASGAEGLRYSLFGNRLHGMMSETEVGQIVWPDRVSNVVHGQVTFPGAGTVSVVLTPRENASYKVTISGDQSETFWVTDKSPTGFVLHSSEAASTASVDWVVFR